jgi:hypothetical protein
VYTYLNVSHHMPICLHTYLTELHNIPHVSTITELLCALMTHRPLSNVSLEMTVKIPCRLNKLKNTRTKSLEQKKKEGLPAPSFIRSLKFGLFVTTIAFVCIWIYLGIYVLTVSETQRVRHTIYGQCNRILRNAICASKGQFVHAKGTLNALHHRERQHSKFLPYEVKSKFCS